MNVDPETFGTGVSMIKDEVRCLLSLSLLFGRLTRRHSETTWTQHRDLASASELLQQRWDRTVLVLCPLHSSVFLLSKDLAQVQQSEKKTSFKDHKAKLQVRFIWISKNISL